MKPVLRHLIFCLLCLCASAASPQEESQSWYEADGLNSGLGPAPEKLDRTTPRAAVRSFVELTDKGDFDRAAHILNLSELPGEEQAARGPELAAQLASVIDRRVWIDWASLSARPDAMVEPEAGDHPLAGQTRRNLGLKLIEIDGRAYEVRIGRYKAGEDDPVWLFTPQTVEDVTELYDAFGPRRFEQFIPDSLKKRAGQLRVWEWAALPLFLGLLGLLGWATNRLVRGLAARIKGPFLHQALDRAATPLALVVSAFAAQSTLNLAVSFSGPVTNVVRPALVIVMVSGIGIAALRVVDAVIDRITLRVVGDIDDRHSADKRELYTSIYALRRIIVLLMVGFAIVYVLLRLNIFESLGLTLLASAGVLTVLLGIAGQAVLGNIMASLQIALAKPVRIGDSVLFEGHWAYVESIYYTFIRLRTWDHRRIVVPVKYFISQPFENWSVKDAKTLKTIKLMLDHSADISALRVKFRQITNGMDGIIEPDELKAYVTGHTINGQEMSFYAMSPDPSTAWEVEMEIREKLIAFISEEHPEWWPRERVEGSGDRNEAAAAD